MSVISLTGYVYNDKLLVFLRGEVNTQWGTTNHLWCVISRKVSTESSVNGLTQGNIKYWVNRTARVTLEVREERCYSNILVCIFTPKEPYYFPFALLNIGACFLLGFHLNMYAAKCLRDVSHQGLCCRV